MNRLLTKISPKGLFILLMGLWWVVNLFQAAFTELANDEAYYFLFAQNLDWGYFDHPPLTALLVWLGQCITGELGVRLLCLSLQPLYLTMFYLLLRPQWGTRSDVTLFVTICAAMPMLQLYGFIAVPDVPLMFFTALLLVAYDRFTKREGWAQTLLLAVAVAGLAYSKYQGALVVFFLVLSNLKLLLKAKVYVAALIAVILILPHIWWLWQHDWITVEYHLTQRYSTFKWSFVTTYILNIVAVFNPLLFPLYVVAFKRYAPKDALQRAMLFIAAGFVLFFGATTLRGNAQPQWIIPITFSLVAWLFFLATDNERIRRYVMGVGLTTVGLIVLVRIVMIFNPVGLRMEIFDNHTAYQTIAQHAKGRPVIFAGGYNRAAKYMFYGGGVGFAQPSVGYRSSEWQFTDYDSSMVGLSVLVECRAADADTTIALPNIRKFTYKVVDNFHPVRMVKLVSCGALPEKMSNDLAVAMTLRCNNPYPYPVSVGGDEGYPLWVIFSDRIRKWTKFDMEHAPFTIPANGSTTIDVSLCPRGLAEGSYTVGIAIKHPELSEWYNSKPWRVEIL